MNVIAQEVAMHLKERVISINEGYNVQGCNAEEMYHEANMEVGKLRRSLEAMNQRYMVAQSELHLASSSAEETARQHAREMFNKDLERQETIREYYNQESTQQGIILDLQRNLLNEEQSVQKVQKALYERRNEAHDMQLELNEAVGHSRPYEAQLAIQDKVRQEIIQDRQTPQEEIEKAYPILASEKYSLKEVIKEKDAKLKQQSVIMAQYTLETMQMACLE